MTTHTQEAHWLYTMDEFDGPSHKRMLDVVFGDPTVQVVYDLGANVGATATLFLQRRPEGTIVCFEPDEDNVAFMRKRLADLVDEGRVIVVPKGVFYGKSEARVHCTTLVDENGSETFYVNVGGWSIEECAQQRCKMRQQGGESVGTQPFGSKIFQLGTVEDLAQGFPAPDFVKIDVEGAEMNILQHSTLLRNAKYIWVEWNQNESVEKFVNEYLPEFEIVDMSADVLLKKRA